MSAFEITLGVSALVLAFYALNGLYHYVSDSTFDGFFLGNRNIKVADVKNTFAGASLSISTVLVFFLTLSIPFGWQIMISPITLILGVIFFGKYIYPYLKDYPNLLNSLKGLKTFSIDSLEDLVYFFYKDKLISKTVTYISAIGIFSILVAEMMVGVTIYQEYFIKPIWIVLIIALTLFVYAGFGGLRSVVITDKWQIRIITLSIIFVVLGILFTTNFDVTLEVFSNWKPVDKMPTSLYLNIFLINLCFLPSSLRIWQIVSASSKSDGFEKGLWQSTIIIAIITVLAIFTSKAIFFDSQIELANFNLLSIFGYLSANSSWFLSKVVYPLFITALLSALISTADSAILPLTQILTNKEKSLNQKTVFLKIGLILITVLALYILVTEVIGLGIIPLILTVFSVTTCIVPAILIPIWSSPKSYNKFSTRIISFSLILGCLLALIWSIVYKDNIAIQAYNCLIGLVITTFGTLIGTLFADNKNELFEEL